MGFLELDPKAVLLNLIAFVLLVWIIRKYGWDKVVAMVKQREDQIQETLDRAARERQEAEQFRTSLLERLARIEDEHRDRVQQAVREATEAGKRILTETEAERSAMLERAKQEITYAKQQALIELRDHTADLVTSVAAKALRRTLDDATQRRLIDETIRELASVGSVKADA